MRNVSLSFITSFFSGHSSRVSHGRLILKRVHRGSFLGPVLPVYTVDVTQAFSSACNFLLTASKFTKRLQIRKFGVLAFQSDFTAFGE